MKHLDSGKSRTTQLSKVQVFTKCGIVKRSKLLSMLQAFFFVICTLLMSAGMLFGQDVFRGEVKVKVSDPFNEKNRSMVASVLVYATGKDIAVFDTIYRSHLICGDTIISKSIGLDGEVALHSIDIGASMLLKGEGAIKHYVKLPPRKSVSMVGSSSASDWIDNVKKEKRKGFDYDYMLTNPENKTVKIYAEVDESTVYPQQYALGGTFRNIFHPKGRYNQIIMFDGNHDVLHQFSYLPDNSLSCDSIMGDYPILDAGEDEIAFLEGFEQLKGRGKEVKKDTLIDRLKREPLKWTDQTTRLSGDGEPSLSEFEGKVVLIDFWASWCAPCRAEMPYLKDLRQEFSREELEILSVSFDKVKDAKKWKRAVKELKLDWHNWHVLRGFGSLLAHDYNIRAVPRYMILDRRGRIAADKTARPSDPELLTLLKEVVNEVED